MSPIRFVQVRDSGRYMTLFGTSLYTQVVKVSPDSKETD